MRQIKPSPDGQKSLGQQRSCLIVGAGIAGLATALALHLSGWRLRVLESRAELPPDGATITLWPNGVQCLAALGIDAEAFGAALAGVEVRRLEGALLGVSPLHEMRKRYGAPVVVIERRILLAALAEGLPVGCVRFGTLGARLVQNDHSGVCLKTADGSFFDGCMLIAADGANSALRQQIVGTTRIVPTSVHNWLGNLQDSLPGIGAGMGLEYLGPDRRLGLMPLRSGGVYFRLSAYLEDAPDAFGASPAKVAAWAETLFPTPRTETIAAFITVLHSANSGTLYRAEERDIEPLEQWHHGRAVLVGDAAHMMTSGLGQGGNLALEDALAPTRCFWHRAPRRDCFSL
jgi:FAD-dependent urate hydroxylase